MRSQGVFFVVLLLVFSGCRVTDRRDRIDTDILHNPKSQFSKDPEKMPVIHFEEPTFGFGVLSDGERINHSFHFTNEGKSPLVLSFVEGSCGCTVMKDWPRDPIPPGGAGSINVEFNSKNKRGFQSVAIRVVANTSPSTTVLTLEGEIVTPE